jgi:hypothetical protein
VCLCVVVCASLLLLLMSSLRLTCYQNFESALSPIGTGAGLPAAAAPVPGSRRGCPDGSAELPAGQPRMAAGLPRSRPRHSVDA